MKTLQEQLKSPFYDDIYAVEERIFLTVAAEALKGSISTEEEALESLLTRGIEYKEIPARATWLIKDSIEDGFRITNAIRGSSKMANYYKPIMAKAFELYDELGLLSFISNYEG